MLFRDLLICAISGWGCVRFYVTMVTSLEYFILSYWESFGSSNQVLNSNDTVQNSSVTSKNEDNECWKWESQRQMELFQGLLAGIHKPGESAQKWAEKDRDIKLAKLSETDDILTTFERLMVSYKIKPMSSENGDPPKSICNIRDLGPHFPNILGMLGSPISYDIWNPSMKLGTPWNFWGFC